MADHLTENKVNRAESAGVVHMNGCVEAASHFKTIAGPRDIGDTFKSAINAVTAEIRRIGGYPIKPSRVEDIWTGEARRIDSAEMDAIRATAAAKARAKEEAKNAVRSELAKVYDRLAAVEAHLARVDPDFHGEARHAQVQQMGVVGRILGGDS